MSGTAYTVVDNSGEIRDFAVDIVGTVDNGKGSTPMIMAKASGPVVEQAGGILQGMSGSPVYVDGKLAGSKPFASKGDASTAADILVGKGFTGDIDFLRLAHASLAESHTDIRELYTWEFAGPFLKTVAK